MKALVYHIPDPNNPGLENGYVGVVKEEKGIYKRFREHANDKRQMRSIIRKHDIKFEDVSIIFEGDIADCYNEEKRLRPEQNIGWNLAKGGGGPYYSSIENLNEFRSKHQSERMRNEDLKRKQGESFKKNYYSNKDSQALRSQRAKEHMNDPEKKAKCLSGLHAKHKCPFCDFESNKGNLTRHIKKRHEDRIVD
jgi:hypothetical protein